MSRIDAHDGVVAFTGRRLGPSGTDADERMRVGRIDVERGSVLWTARIRLRNYDASQAELHVAGSGSYS